MGFVRAMWLGIWVAVFSLTAWAGAPEVAVFSPQGNAKGVRQVRVLFTEAMIAFGDPRSKGDPFEISCPQKGSARWADAKNWIFDFEADLPGGIQCVFKVKEGFTSLAGAAIQGKKEFSFNTGGPSLKQSDPWANASSIDEEQAFVLTMDAEADKASVLRHAYFEVSGINEKIPAKVLDKDPREGGARRRRYGYNQAPRPQIVLQATRRFPPGASVTLVWGKGITAVSGGSTNDEQTYSYKVRTELEAEFSCERENAEAACIPFSAMSLRFSADIPRGQIKKIKLRAKAGGKEWSPYFSKDEASKPDSEGTSYVQFQGPFPENTQFEVIVPKGLTDDAGRTLSNAAKFPLAVATAEYPPLVKFPADFGLLELKPEAILPVTVRNVEATLKGKVGLLGDSAPSASAKLLGKLLRIDTSKAASAFSWLARISQAKREESVFGWGSGVKTEGLLLPKPGGERAFEVMGIPLKRPGFYVVEFESLKLGSALGCSSQFMFRQRLW